MAKCNICPRNCNIDRTKYTGFCQNKETIKIAKSYLHMWEEPCISGTHGSGTIFFSGCNLKCVFCQNHQISTNNYGINISINKLSDIMLELQNIGAHNINLVTPSHFVLKIIKAIRLAKKNGLIIPIIYNTSAYEKVETIKLLNGYIDIYLPDLKYYDDKYALKYSNAKDYFKIASTVIMEMYKQVGKPKFNKKGIIEKGLIVRHMVMPSLTNDSKYLLEYLYNTYKNNIYISIMNQFTPINLKNYPEINRTLTKKEYNDVLDYAIKLGIENAYIQEGKTCKESFIPDFNLEGTK